MKKSLIIASVIVGILIVSFVSAGWFTGNAIKSGLWSADWCNKGHQCPAGEGDCDASNHCLTGYCAPNVGEYYGQVKKMDVCETKKPIPPCPTVRVKRIGDVTDDKKITESDARLILMYVAGLVELTEKQMERAELSGDG